MDNDGSPVKKFEPQRTHTNFVTWIKNAATAITLVGFLGLVFAFASISNTQAEIQDFQVAGRERTYQSRAVACESVIIDNDRSFALSANCTEDGVLAYYPPEICEVFGNPPACGIKNEPSPYPDPEVP